jgi:putative transposase
VAEVSKLPYWRAFYHLVWGTRHREPLISVAREDLIQRSIRSQSHDGRALIHAIGFMPDHIHVVASIPPAIAVSTLVGRMKGASSHLVNSLEGSIGAFGWQPEFGMVTFGEKSLDLVKMYVLNQKQRHTSGTLWETLERYEVEPNRQPA